MEHEIIGVEILRAERKLRNRGLRPLRHGVGRVFGNLVMGDEIAQACDQRIGGQQQAKAGEGLGAG